MKRSENKNFIFKAFSGIRKFFALCAYDLSALSIRDKNMIVFSSQKGRDICDNPLYIYREIKKRAIYRLIWILKDKESIRKNRALGYECYYYKSLKGRFYQLRAKYFVHSHSLKEDFNNILLGGATSICTWHGVGLKKELGSCKETDAYKAVHESNSFKKFIKLGLNKVNRARVNYAISTSDRVSSNYPETFVTDEEKILQLGQARNDIFFKDDEISSAYLDYLRENKIILYIPANRTNEESTIAINKVIDFGVLESFCEEYDYKFVIKAEGFSDASLDEKYDNIIDASDWNIESQLFLKYADILITDYSSCYADYLMLDRPVIFYCHDCEDYMENESELHFEYDDVTPGEKVQKFEDLMAVLQFTAIGGDFYKAERKRVLDIFYSKENQGRVTEKQVDYILGNIINI